eukprot:TRINITY_DN687_c1_g1_i2.p1 TRINITY_DN687_c1_g1~~TRINITY_DN687_c1_g1_i2.p1  ORF type:complete len:463 (+),score=138.78 TRINITY_DN687_c1_g1_i2:139-1389(+)
MNEKRPESEKVPYTKMKMWWIGIVLMMCGETGNFTAFSFAPVHVIAPLGAVSVISNAVIASYFLNEKMRIRDVWGIAVAVVGTTIIVIASPDKDPDITAATLLDYMSSAIFILYLIGIMAGIGYLLHLSKQGMADKYVIVNIGICSLIGSITVMSSKGVSTFLRLTIGGHSQLNQPIFYFLVLIAAATAVLQVRFLNKAMEKFGSTEVVPVFYVTFTMCSIAGGIVLYREFAKIGFIQLVGFFIGCCCTFAGVYLITSNRHEQAYHVIPADDFMNSQDVDSLLVDEEYGMSSNQLELEEIPASSIKKKKKKDKNGPAGSTTSSPGVTTSGNVDRSPTQSIVIPSKSANSSPKQSNANKAQSKPKSQPIEQKEIQRDAMFSIGDDFDEGLPSFDDSGSKDDPFSLPESNKDALIDFK